MSKIPKTKNKNALRHGMYASEVVLPWESEAAFAELLKEFQAEYKPKGPTEEELVFDLVRLRWIKRRIVRSAQLAFHEDVMATRIGQATKGDLQAIMDYVKTEAEKSDVLRAALKRISTTVEEQVKNLLGQVPNEKMSPDDRIALQELTEKRSAVLSATITGILIPLAKSIEGLRNEKGVIEKAYSAEMLEKFIRLEAAVDTRFDKTLGRLLAIQDYRRAASIKQIEHSSK